jgi:hypothetical protein
LNVAEVVASPGLSGHRVLRAMRGDQLVAQKRSPPIALAARDKYGLALFIGEPIETLA